MRPAILKGMLAAAVTVVLGVELLSALGVVRQLPLLALTMAAALVFRHVLLAGVAGGPQVFAGRPAHPRMFAALIGIGVITLLVALLGAPNSWDSMTYHLARVAQWFDHGNVEPYFTTIDRQLWQPPLGEYLVLLGYGGLGGRDYLANLPQWLAGVGAVLVVMEIATLLGAGTRSRYVVALLAATAPAIILQSSSTLTDLLGGFWVACAAWLALSQYLAPRFDARHALWFGAALGLAIGTKGTSIPLGIPWLVLFLVPALRARKLRAALTQLAGIGLAVLVLVGGHFLRNLAMFGNPFGPETVQRMLRPASLGIPALISNLVAHLSLQLGTPWEGVNALMSGGIAGLHSLLGVDLSVLYPYFGGFRVFGWTFSEDIAGNLVQTVLGLAATALLIGTWRRTPAPERFAATGFLVGLALFTLTVRWQPFIARLHTPLIVLLPPSLLYLLDRRWPRVTTAGVLAAFLFAIPPLIANTTRPIIPLSGIGWTGIRARSILFEPREAQYFVNRRELYAPYRSAIEALSRLGCNRVALQAGYDSWEYPLWALGRKHDLRFEHFQPGNTAASPCAVVGLDQPADWRPAHLPPEAVALVSTGTVTVWR